MFSFHSNQITELVLLQHASMLLHYSLETLTIMRDNKSYVYVVSFCKFQLYISRQHVQI